jgi:dihydrodipicolinate synthase/N-acetylneuraminate lyase
LATQTVAASGCGGLLGVGGWGDFATWRYKEKIKKIGSAKNFVGKKIPTNSPYFQE